MERGGHSGGKRQFMATYHERCSYTADGVAYARALSNIPFSKEIFRLLEEMDPLDQAEKKARLNHVDVTAFFEARYRMTDREIAKSGVRQVLELASGFSPRGMIMTEDPSSFFVEVDLPDKLAVKRQIVNRLIRNQDAALRSNLCWIAGNVLDENVFAQAARLFRKEAVAVVCEGLLRYVSHKDKAILAGYIHEFLEQFGGVWITPDVETVDDEMALPGAAERLQRLGAGMLSNIFATRQQVFGFFKDLGFAPAETPLTGIMPELVTPKRLGADRERVERFLKIRSVLVLRPI
jgi:O-methyltransferase involved in polyketide biosynthesis